MSEPGMLWQCPKCGERLVIPDIDVAGARHDRAIEVMREMARDGQGLTLSQEQRILGVL